MRQYNRRYTRWDNITMGRSLRHKCRRFRWTRQYADERPSARTIAYVAMPHGRCQKFTSAGPPLLKRNTSANHALM